VNLVEPIDSGRVVVEDITAPGVDANRIGIVYQAFNLFPHMTVLRNITLAPREALKTDRKAAEKQDHSLLERFGLLDKRDEYPDRLSGGQQQRVAIVRALAMHPSLMLLDEVTSALDPELVAEVLAVIRELANEGTTMLIATHEMGFTRDIADRVCFLDAGRILEQGPPGKIFTAPEHPAPPGSSRASPRRATPARGGAPVPYVGARSHRRTKWSESCSAVLVRSGTMFTGCCPSIRRKGSSGLDSQQPSADPTRFADRVGGRPPAMAALRPGFFGRFANRPRAVPSPNHRLYSWPIVPAGTALLALT